MAHRFFLDETGDHGLKFIDPNFPLFLLCGCLMTDASLTRIEAGIDSLKQDIFRSEGVILHSRDIRKCEGAFQVLFDPDVKKEFYERLNKIMQDSDYTIIGAAINKEEHIMRYGKSAANPYSIALAFVLERMVFCRDSIGGDSNVSIMVETRGRREDDMLLAQYNSIIDGGTYYVSKERFEGRIANFSFHLKRHNINGLQMADLCAYPLARHILNPKEPYIPFEIIKNKIYCSKEGKYDGYGLKVFP